MFDNSLIVSSIRRVEPGSRAEHGSSISNTSGFTASDLAIQRRCCWPPDSAPPYSFRRSLTSPQRPDTEPDVITALKDIVKNHRAQKIRDGKNGKTVTVDVQSANAVVHIYNGLGTSNRIKYVNSGLISMVNMAWKILAR